MPKVWAPTKNMMLYILVAYLCLLLNIGSANFHCPEHEYQVLYVQEGVSITLPCTYTPANIDTDVVNFYWYAKHSTKQGKSITLYANEEIKQGAEDAAGNYSLVYRQVNPAPTGSSNLTILSAHRDNPLIYKCRVSAPSCRFDRSFTVIVNFPATIQYIGPRRAPYWTPAEPGKITVNETDDVTLICYARGEPPPSNSWAKTNDDGEVIYNTTLSEKKSNGNLTLTNVSRAQSGIYRCQSTNTYGNDTADVELEVQYAPEVITYQSDIRAAPGEALSIVCNVTALPEPLDFYWLKDDVRIKDGDEDDEGSIPNAISLSCFPTFTRFVIFSLDPSKDYGNYTCVATNKVGTSTATVNINGRPPAPVILDDETQGRYGRFHTLVWSPYSETESDNSQLTDIPISRYVIQYQRQDAEKISNSRELDEINEVSVRWPDEALSAAPGRHGSFVLENLIENSSYVGLLCPGNDHGLGDCTPFTFTTSDVVEKRPPEPISEIECVGADPCKGVWLPNSAAVRDSPVTMVTISTGFIVWLLMTSL